MRGEPARHGLTSRRAKFVRGPKKPLIETMQGQCIGSGRKGHLVLGNGHSLFLPLVRGLGRAQSAHIQGRKGFIYGETRLRPFMAPRSKSDRMNEFDYLSDGALAEAITVARDAAHSAPLGEFNLRADGTASIRNHTTSWARRSDEWCRLCAERDRRARANRIGDG